MQGKKNVERERERERQRYREKNDSEKRIKKKARERERKKEWKMGKKMRIMEKGVSGGKKKKEERKEDREEKLKWTRTFRFNKILLGMVLTRIRLANGNYDRIAMVKRRSVQQCGALKRVYTK